MSIEIESGFEIPVNPVGRKRIYPFADMQIGSSFSVPYSKAARNSIGACAHRACKQYGMKFMSRHIEAEGVLRTWRIK